MPYKIGDRIILIRTFIAASFTGDTGRVLLLNAGGRVTAVEMDKYCGGHNAGGRGVDGRCWYMGEEFFKPYIDAETPFQQRVRKYLDANSIQEG